MTQSEEGHCFCSVVLRLGGMGSAKFRGVLSLVQVWNVTRNSTDIKDVFTEKATDITSPSYTEELIADWCWDSFQPGPGMAKISPSTRGQTVCPAGRMLDTDGSTCVKKIIGKGG